MSYRYAIATLCWVSAFLPLQAGAAEGESAEIPVVTLDEAPTYVYPQRREQDGYVLILHAPQIRTWPEFKTFDAVMAVELTPAEGCGPFVGSLSLSGATSVDLANRIVLVTDHQITDVSFSGAATEDYESYVKKLTTRDRLDFPLDLFLAHVANDVLSDPPPAGFNTNPPPIYVSTTPAMLLLVNGTPVLSDVADSGLKVVVNANWPVYQEAAGSGPFYLLNNKLWLTSDSLEGPWQAAKTLPASFSKVPADDEFCSSADAEIALFSE